MKALRKTKLKLWPALMLIAPLALQSLAGAQDYIPDTEAPAAAPNAPPAQLVFSQQQLDQMLAPIALYPDALLSQILMAATYPLEVVEAARWSTANPGRSGDAAVRAVESRDWDPSVKSLTAFPRVLQMMGDKLEWTENLGDAFLAQQSQVMDTIQSLRQRAYAAGNLKSNDEVSVQNNGQSIAVAPTNPDVVYVPYYDPTVVYGAWWWPDYPPVFWPPWPGYFVASGFAWGAGIFVTTGFFFGACDWPHRRVIIVNVHNYYYPPAPRGHALAPGEHRGPGPWHHNPFHRRGEPYPDAALRNRYRLPQGSPVPRRSERPVGIAPAPAVGKPAVAPGGGEGEEQLHPRLQPPRHPESPPSRERQAPQRQPRQESERRLEHRPQIEPHPAPETGVGAPPGDFERRYPGVERAPSAAAPRAPEGFGRGLEAPNVRPRDGGETGTMRNQSAAPDRRSRDRDGAPEAGGEGRHTN